MLPAEDRRNKMALLPICKYYNLLNEHNFKEAVEAASQELEKGAEPAVKASLYAILADAYVGQALFNEAHKAIAQAYLLPRTPSLETRLGLTRVRISIIKKDFAKAEALAVAGITANEQFSDLQAKMYLALALTKNEEGKYVEAKEAAEMGLKLEAKEPEINASLSESLARALYHLNESKMDVIAVAHRGLEFKGTNIDTSALLYCRLALCYKAFGFKQQAEESAWRGIRLDPAKYIMEQLLKFI